MFFSTALTIAVAPLLAIAVPTKRAGSSNIHIPGNLNKCLGVKVNPTDGTAIQSIPCGQSGYLTGWDIAVGNNVNGISLSGTKYCIDATTGTTNNTPLKVWTCYPPNLKQQTWYYTDDMHIAVTGSNQCIDLGPSGPQTYQCIGGNTNQIWSTNAVTTGKTSTSSAPGPTKTTTSSAPVVTPTPPVVPGQQIHFKGSSTGCLTTGHGAPGVGSVVYINGCAPNKTSTYASTQLWDITRNVAGPVKLASNPKLCLDAGVNPDNNGSPVTVYTCLTKSDGTPVAQQNWYYTDDNHLAIVSLTQCLDVVRDSKPGSTKPDGSLQDVSTYKCSGPDAQQIFTI